MRVKSVFNGDIDWSMKVKGVDLGGITGKGSGEKEFLAL